MATIEAIKEVKVQMARANQIIERLAKSLGTDEGTVMQAIDEELDEGDGRLVGAVANLMKVEQL